VTATDFRGHTELLRLNSPDVVQETEHRLPVAFRADTRASPLADPLELVLAARATASFPGAFPPLMLSEIEHLADSEGLAWDSREAFIERIMPVHARDGTVREVSLIDGSVLVNAPFGAALQAIAARPSQREVDRRIVYIDPRPDRAAAAAEQAGEPVGFFGAILGSLSTIPREQPIRDDLERIEQLSRDARRMRRIVMSMHPEIDRAVEKLFGYTFFLDRPTPKRLANWRAKAHDAAAMRAGFAYNAYAQTKFASILDRLAAITHEAAPQIGLADCSLIAERLREHLAGAGLETLVDENGRASEASIGFFRIHDIGFRIRRRSSRGIASNAAASRISASRSVSGSRRLPAR
jgi:patatin-related protein